MGLNRSDEDLNGRDRLFFRPSMDARDHIVPWRRTYCFTTRSVRPRRGSRMLESVADQICPVCVASPRRVRCHLPTLSGWYLVGQIPPQLDGSVERSLGFPLARASEVRSSAHITALIALVLDPADGEGRLLTSTVGWRGLVGRRGLTRVVRSARVKRLCSLDPC